VSRSKIYEMIAEGVIPSVRIPGNRLIRVPTDALRKFAAAPTSRKMRNK
jgi:excisionase family DNA binding protein